MKIIDIKEYTKPQSDIARSKRLFGLLYGIFTGLGYACAVWAFDGYRLNEAHAYFPWNMLIVGAILCALVGGLIGWLTSRMENSLLGVFFWLLFAVFLAWVTVSLPMQITPFIASKLDPQLGNLLTHEREVEFISRFGVTFAWIVPMILIVGVTQLPILEPAVFSTSFFGKIKPFLFSVIIVSLGAVMIDDVIDRQFRNAIISLDKTIQFVVDNKDNPKVDKTLSREMRARSMAEVMEEVSASRNVFIAGFDESLEDVEILVKFEDSWVICEVLYSQPISCKPAMQ
jgi:hypothetical protein